MKKPSQFVVENGNNTHARSHANNDSWQRNTWPDFYNGNDSDEL